ncbi:MAG: hypothetical protein HFJ09_08530 [Lachnospiraceae bacterium]|nr:hypothetical protein [Lachnospiraceae bacterium]
MKNYKQQIKEAKSIFELSCIDELVRDAYFNKKSISKVAYEKRSEEICQRITELKAG